jgi:hypothetical protein
MPDWNQLNDEIKSAGGTYDIIRRKYLRNLNDMAGRNTVIYYSGWMQKPGVEGAEINDEDKIGLMTTIHGMDRTKGLDLILHTPGGETAATESIVHYLRQMFGKDIRAIVPQIAMSGGTMIACACKSVMMGKQSNLGPIDPQYAGLPAHGVIEEFQRAVIECTEDKNKIPLWQPIIARYTPTLLGECQKSIIWSNEMVRDWLLTGMLENKPDKEQLADRILQELGDHALTKSHARHISADKCEEIGLVVERMEDDDDLQDAILSVHHACIHTLSSTPAFKIIENQNGRAYIKMAQIVVTPQR